MNRPPPYIGITDFINIEQVMRMLAVFKKYRKPDSKHLLHVGVMMSYKTLYGLDTKWAKAFPQKEYVADIFGCDDTYNCLHYADYAYHDTIDVDIAKAISYGGIGIHAVQLDMIWPDPGLVGTAVHTSRKQLEVILQIGRDAMEEAHNSPAEVVERLEDYRGAIHRVLLDKSMGQGKGMKAEELLPYARAIRARFPNLGIGMAGGLGPYSTDLIAPALAEFSDLSADAQSKNRPSGNALDPVDWDMAGLYLQRMLELVNTTA